MHLAAHAEAEAEADQSLPSLRPLSPLYSPKQSSNTEREFIFLCYQKFSGGFCRHMLRVTHDLLQGHLRFLICTPRRSPRLDWCPCSDGHRWPSRLHTSILMHSAYCCWHGQGCSARRVDLWGTNRKNTVFCTLVLLYLVPITWGFY